MHGPILHTALVRWIRSVFQEGLVLTADVIQFMESVFGTQDIEAVLKEAHDCESGSLLELLCFPDRELRLRFERRWGGHAFTTGDQRTIISQLCRTPLHAVVKSTSGAALVPPSCGSSPGSSSAYSPLSSSVRVSAGRTILLPLREPGSIL